MSDAQAAERLMGATDRGTLWMVRGDGARTSIERRLDPRHCDHGFRESLAALKDKRYPRLVGVGGEGWSGAHYRIEYPLDDPFVELGLCFEGLHWRRRLEIVVELCRILPEWSQPLVRPFGLNPLNLVVSEFAGRRYPWLLACPPVNVESVWDLHICDASVLCCIAPEVIRGMPVDARLVDSFALGALAAMALGFKPSEELGGAEALEAQACGALLPFDPVALPVERFLCGMEQVKHLACLIARHLELAPTARPASASELQEACERAVAASEPLALALALAGQKRAREALEVIEWGIGAFGESIEERLLASELATQIDDLQAALHHLDRCVELVPGELGLRARRVEVAFRAYLAKIAPHPGDPDAEGERLLRDLELMKLLPQEAGRLNLIHLRAAAVHRHRGDLYAAAAQLHEAAGLEPSDLDALYEYSSCLRDLSDAAGTRAAALQGVHRVERMALAQMLSETEAARWKAKFSALLPQPLR